MSVFTCLAIVHAIVESRSKRTQCTTLTMKSEVEMFRKQKFSIFQWYKVSAVVWRSLIANSISDLCYSNYRHVN